MSQSFEWLHAVLLERMTPDARRGIYQTNVSATPSYWPGATIRHHGPTDRRSRRWSNRNHGWIDTAGWIVEGRIHQPSRLPASTLDLGRRGHGDARHPAAVTCRRCPASIRHTGADVVFLFDVDNTLLDNDRVTADLRRYLEKWFGPEVRDRYFTIFEELRAELGYADYLGTLQRYRLEAQCDPELLMMSEYLVEYPFANRLYPGSLDALEHVRQWGPTVILSDGDVVFQPRKSAAVEFVGRGRRSRADLHSQGTDAR